MTVSERVNNRLSHPPRLSRQDCAAAGLPFYRRRSLLAVEYDRVYKCQML
jgi:hypothetical protein